MTQFTTLFFLALPFNAGNKDLMSRVSVAVFAEGITAGERNQLLSGTKTIAQVIAAHSGDQSTIDSINANSNGFQTVYSTSTGLTQDYYAGSASMDSNQAGRMAGFANSAPGGSIYCEATLQPDETWKVSNRHSNTPVLNALEGQIITGPTDIVNALGWKHYTGGGYF